MATGKVEKHKKIVDYSAMSASDLTENDVLPVWDADAGAGVEPTKKITVKNLATGLSPMFGVNYLDQIWSEYVTSTSTKTFTKKGVALITQGGPIDSAHVATIYNANGGVVLSFNVSPALSTVPFNAGDKITITGNTSYASLVRAYGVS